ncbi:MAG: hypothetical protein LH605_11155 [Microbacteriaceae bacterium]|nr:hypothetical protein [Microbacteriaceae bacterium]
MNIVHRRRAAFALGGLSVAATLVGCTPASAPASPGAGAAPTSTGSYADGEYSATGEYQSPGGPESIEVTLALEGNLVTEVTVTGNATAGNALRYQTEFEEGIASEVVGVNIDDLAVDKVAGSSLTSDGFNDAIAQIKADADA